MRAWLLTALLLLAGCAEDAPEAPDVQVEDDEEPQIIHAVTYHNVTGTLTGLNVGPAPATGDYMREHGFEVPLGTARVDVFLAWSDPVFTLDLAVLGLEGTTKAESGIISFTAMDPAPGNYSARVSTQAAAMVDYELSIRFSPDPSATAFLSATATIPPGAFFEINLNNPLNSTLHWSWTASSTSDFNLHTHFDGDVDYPVRYTGTQHAGNYTVVREGGHSLMWENPGGTPQTVQYRVWGDFTVDSYFP